MKNSWPLIIIILVLILGIGAFAVMALKKQPASTVNSKSKDTTERLEETKETKQTNETPQTGAATNPTPDSLIKSLKALGQDTPNTSIDSQTSSMETIK